MNVLVIHLLELKSLCSFFPVLKRIKEENPQSRIHLLVNEANASQALEMKAECPFLNEVSSLSLSFFPEELFLEVTKRSKEQNQKQEESENSFLFPEAIKSLRPLSEKHFFENLIFRNVLPDELSLDHFSVRSLDQFKEQMKGLMEREYDQIVNLTHNTIGGWISFFLKSRNKVGFHFNSRGLTSFGSTWMRHWSEKKVQNKSSVFHSGDLVYYASRNQEVEEEGERTFNLVEFPKTFLSEKEKEEKAKNPFLFIHPFSEKKDHWDLDQIRDSLKEIYKDFKEKIFFFLIHGLGEEPYELTLLKRKCLKEGLPVFIASQNLREIFSLMKKASLILTRGNTCFQHLASLTQTKLVELHLSEEDGKGEGAYRDNTLLIESRKDFFVSPRVLSGILHRIFECKEDLSSSDFILEGGFSLLKDQWEQEVDLSVTDRRHLNFWARRPLIPKEGKGTRQEDHKECVLKFLKQSFERLSLKILFEREHLESIGSYGTESLKLKALMQGWLFKLKIKEPFSLLSNLEEKALSRHNSLEKMIPTCLKALCFGEQEELLPVFEENKEGGDEENFDFLSSFSKSPFSLAYNLKDSNLFFLRRVQSKLEDLSQKNEIQLKLIRCLREH